MKRTLAAIALACALVAPAAAAEKTMSADFTGDWCYGDGYDAQTKETNYRLPSWMPEDMPCDKAKILSIRRYDILFHATDESCEIVNARYTSESGHTGTRYTARITAKCSPDGEWKPKPKTFVFYRYKGNLYVK